MLYEAKNSTRAVLEQHTTDLTEARHRGASCLRPHQTYYPTRSGRGFNRQATKLCIRRSRTLTNVRKKLSNKNKAAHISGSPPLSHGAEQHTVLSSLQKRPALQSTINARGFRGCCDQTRGAADSPFTQAPALSFGGWFQTTPEYIPGTRYSVSQTPKKSTVCSLARGVVVHKHLVGPNPVMHRQHASARR